MFVISEKTITSYSVKTTGEIDKHELCKKDSCSTKWKAVDGMPNVKWSLQFYANDPSNNGYTAMYFQIDSDVEIDWSISSFYIKNAISGSSTGFKSVLVSKLYVIDEFDPNSSRYKREKIPFQADAIFSYKNNESIEINNSKEWGLRLKENSTEDFEIAVGDENFKVHKLIIAAESPVFKKMFESDFKEAKENKVTIIDFEPQIVKAFIDYCYGQDISLENETDKINLLYFSDKYDCQTLKPKLETQFVSKISKENISLYVSAADNANALQLRHACVEFVRTLLKNNESLSEEVFDSLDKAFMKDVFCGNLVGV